MTWDKFYRSTHNIHKTYAIWLKPSLSRLPLPIQRYDEPFFPLSKSIIQATQPYVGMYIFDLASYLAIGAAGIVALERAITYAKQDGITILHGSFTGKAYSILADEGSLTVDGLTVTSLNDLAYYTSHPPYGAFLFANDDDKPNINRGGILTESSLTLYHPDEQPIDMKVITSDSLLTDLTDTYAESIPKYFV